ncbi:hypothetical protein GCM10011613_10530 [Cellvibrio zantedeschiae]|uniref:Integrin n=1 Tax=Cellvibrio zantedeschiae TaxID=1237077 RepID=A0ABQ3AV09_9GAMM|nr:FG-GAP repeat protein [Cellvibrio zantedeschiae]GGY68216.1 hypothetical protein GCM10011613_10530 [Cellvibrio zantedeschiae]
MNIVRIPRLLKYSTLLLTVLGSSLLLTACGGGSNDNKSTSSSSSSSSSSHTFSSTPVTPPGSGTWPDVKVSASGTKTLKFDWTAVSGATYYKLLKKADSNAAFVQVGSDFTTNSVTDPVSVHLTDWVNSRYKVQACNNAGCQDSNAIIVDSAMVSAISYLKASNTDANDWFGWSVVISGDGKTMAVGAPAESSNAKGVNGDQTSNASPTAGAVYVFAKVNGNWQQEAYLKASNTEQPGDGFTANIPNPNARFGYQVALSTDGNTLAVSAINEDSVSIGVNCDPHNDTYLSSAAANSSSSQSYVTRTTNTDIGAVYVFKRVGVQWTQQAYIKPLLGYYFGNSNMAFGYSLALSGDGKTLAVGTAAENTYGSGIVTPSGDSNSSTAFKCIDFSSSSSTSSSSSSSSTSSSSSSSSNSSSSSSEAGGPNSGAVYIYKLKDDGAWVEEAYVKAADAGKDDLFGAAITLSNDGNSLAVGAPGEDSKDSSANDDIITIDTQIGLLNNGGVYVFAREASKWQQTVKIKPSYNQWNQGFGAAVSISGDGKTLAVGTPGDAVKNAGINPDVGTYDPKDTAAYDSGAVYIFTKSDATWTQQTYIKASTVIPGNQFGDRVSLSANGNILAVGTWLDSSQATGINGDQLDTAATNAGAAYVFTRTGTTWAQKSYVKSPNTGAQDRFARSLDLDDLGESLLIGAYRESSNAVGINGDKANNSAGAAGAVYVY